MRGKTIAATLAGVVVVAVVALIAFVAATWQHGIAEIAPPPAASFDRASVDRGLRVAAAGDCISCHTASGGPVYAGGAPLRTPFGTLYSSNITPDPDSGIGRWSLAAFARAMRAGVARDGTLLYPAFPYPHFTHLSDQDVHDLYAYLMTRTPVATSPPDNALSFPYSFRPLLAVWNLLYLPDGPLPAAAGRGEAWLRGRYLVEGAGHCAACHTPLNALGAPASGRAYAGAIVEGWEAPALTALAHAPRPWTVDQLTAYLRTGLATEHGAAAGPMRDVTRQLANLPEADVRAMAVYLLDLPGARKDDATATATPAASSVAAQPAAATTLGATLYASTCAACHDEGAPMVRIGGRPSLALSSAAVADDPRNAINLVLHGIAQEGSTATPYMPAFGAVLDDAQVAQVLDYMRVQVARRPAWPGLQAAVAAARKETAGPAPAPKTRAGEAQAKETHQP
ncbi:cytochrome c [Achromobacter aloeverae]